MRRSPHPLGQILVLSLIFSSLGPVAGFSGGPELAEGASELKQYFEGCNNYIVQELEDWKLRRDAGDRPTPLEIMGMGDEDANSAQIDFSTTQKNEVWNDKWAKEFLVELYQQGRLNALLAYARLQIQYDHASPTAKALTETVCSLGSGCQPGQAEVTRKLADHVLSTLPAQHQ